MVFAQGHFDNPNQTISAVPTAINSGSDLAEGLLAVLLEFIK